MRLLGVGELRSTFPDDHKPASWVRMEGGISEDNSFQKIEGLLRNFYVVHKNFSTRVSICFAVGPSECPSCFPPTVSSIFSHSNRFFKKDQPKGPFDQGLKILFEGKSHHPLYQILYESRKRSSSSSGLRLALNQMENAPRFFQFQFQGKS